MITVKSHNSTLEAAPPGGYTIKAFPRPQDGAVLHWDVATPPAHFNPFLVQITDIQGGVVTFTVINRDPTQPDAGPFKVDLGDHESGWGLTPSTLNGWDPLTNNCALLFLSAGYAQDNALTASDPTKWPKGAGEVFVENEKLKQQLASLKAKLHQFASHLSGPQKTSFNHTFDGYL